MKLLHRFISRNVLWWFLLFFTCLLAYSGLFSVYLVFPVSLDAALICNFIFSDKTITYNISKKNSLLVLGLVCATWGFTYLFFVPSSLILSDLAEVPVKYSWILPISLGYFLLGTLVLFLIGACMPSFFRIIYTELLFSITFAGYIQNTFLNGKLSPMDGTIQTFSFIQSFLNTLLWIIMILSPFILLWKKRTLATKLFIWGSVFIVFSQMLTMEILWLTAEFSVQHGAELTTDYLPEFHRDNNVLVILLDSFDRQTINDLESQDTDLFAPLKDFTNYSNTTSCYSFTNMCIPYLISGVKCPEGQDVESYMSYADANNIFFKRLAELDCNIQLYTTAPVLRENLKQYVQNMSPDTTGKYDPVAFGKFWSRCARYNLLPFAAKAGYRYTSNDLYGVIYDSKLYKMNDAYVYHAAADDGIRVNQQTNGLFKMIHLNGAHAPYKLTEEYQINDNISTTMEEQARASFGIACAWVEQLKRADIYDKTTIIISADHGRNFPIDQTLMKEKGLYFISSPILFVKMAGESHDAMVTSSAPVSHEEFFATVLKAFGDDTYQVFGRSFDEIDDSEERTRYFMYGQSKYRLYSIKGNVMDVDSWHLEEVIE